VQVRQGLQRGAAAATAAAEAAAGAVGSVAGAGRRGWRVRQRRLQCQQHGQHGCQRRLLRREAQVQPAQLHKPWQARAAAVGCRLPPLLRVLLLLLLLLLQLLLLLLLLHCQPLRQLHSCLHHSPVKLQGQQALQRGWLHG
jgi:hypothetical protein